MISEGKRQVLDLYAEGLGLYRDMDFRKALEKFESALEIDPDDGPSKTFVVRCKKHIKNPPANWDGVYDMRSK